jgi:hypothetical protein
VAFAAILLPALFACATLPPPHPSDSYWGLLPADSELYLYADLRAARGLAEPLAARLSSGDPRRLRPVLERAGALYAGLRWVPGAAPVAGAAVLGRFSPQAVGSRLDWSCDWQRQPGQPSYWRNRRLPLELAAPERGLLLVASGPPRGAQRLLDRWRTPGPNPLTGPEDPAGAGLLQGLLAGSLLYAYLPELPGSSGAPPGLPLSDLWLSVRREAEWYVVGALAALNEEQDPRLLLNVVRLAAAAWLRKAGVQDLVPRLKALRVEVSGRTVVVQGLSLGEGELLRALGIGSGAASEEASGAGGGS